MSELDQLIETANKGEEAAKTICTKYRNKVERQKWGDADSLEMNWHDPTENSFYKWRRKPQTRPAPIAVGTWKAEFLAEDCVQIGCESFPAKRLRDALAEIVEKNKSASYSINGHNIFAQWNGIEWNGNNLDRADAQRLFDWLKKGLE